MDASGQTAIVGGCLVAKARRGGHAWVLLQYLLGLRRLGYDVVFLDRVVPGLDDPDWAVRATVDLLDRLGVDAYSIDTGAGRSPVGMSRSELLFRTRDAAFLLDVMGFVGDEDVLAAAQTRVFLDIDPGFPQVWRQLGLADPFAGYDVFVTVGRNIGRPGCAVPDCGLPWITIPPPVVLEHWPVHERPALDRLTSVATWRGAYGPVEYRGVRYGERVHEFRAFAGVPREVGPRCELALDIDPADWGDVERLRRGGWILVDPLSLAGTPEAYRDYVAGSSAEFMVAKEMYVRSQGGWFSDRGACYLTSGRPVIAQDTGLAPWYPTDKGIVAFSTPDEAVDAIGLVFADYEGHSRAARRLAEEVFDSDVVLGELVSSLGL